MVLEGEAHSGTRTSGVGEPVAVVVAAAVRASPPVSGAEPVCWVMGGAAGRGPGGGRRGSPAQGDSRGRGPGSHSFEDLGCFPPLKSLQQMVGNICMLQAKSCPI